MAHHVDPTREAFAACRADERWDICFIAEYPDVASFVAMVRDPVYREAVKHRQAAGADSRLVRLAPQAAGAGFANPG